MTDKKGKRSKKNTRYLKQKGCAKKVMIKMKKNKTGRLS